MNPKLHVVSLLEKFDEKEYSNIILNNLYKGYIIEEKEKSFITEVFYGVIRHKIFIDYLIERFSKKIKKRDLFYLLEISVYQGLYMNSDIGGTVWEAVELTKKKYGDVMSKFVNGLLRNIFREKDKIIAELQEKGREDILLSYPKWLYDKFCEVYKENALDMLKAYKNTGVLGIRINTLKYTAKEFEIFAELNNVKILQKIDNIYYVDKGTVLSSKEFSEGKITVQDGSSYLAVKLLAPVSGEKILDCCAAPGTKSTMVAELMNNNGKVIAMDISENKMKLIEENIKRLGVKIAEAISMDAREIEKRFKPNFDRVIVDVPCSGFGVLRKKPEIAYYRTNVDIKNLQKLQREILNSAAKVVRNGGTIVYSTCTLFSEENTDNIEWFLENNKNFEVEKCEIDKSIFYTEDKYGGICIDYRNNYFDGFYIIKLKRVI